MHSNEIMLLSDAVGILAGFLLMIPAAKDNFYRFNEARQKKRESQSSWRGLRTIVAEAWKTKRDAFSPSDSLFITLGGLSLAGSFILKAIGK